ncbi:MAG TPA: hypothetical protein VNY36_03305 [Bacteroidia bacterium]|jgi:hypothetical protein|nr:hypothetical protein [Bacteroidia bacterium]
MKKLITICAALILAITLFSFTTDWKTDLGQMLTDFTACKNQSKGAECKTYVAKALKKIYNINDFDATGKPGGFLDVNAVANYIKKDSKWKLLGDASGQDILKQAQDAANNNKAVVAMMVSDNGADHIAIIAPGSLTACGSIKYPNSISFFINNPDKSYISKPLAYSFKSMDGIKVYARN